MDEIKYSGLGGENESRFDYGDREIIINGTRETQLNIPFRNYPLLADTRGYFSSEMAHDFVDGIFRAGRLTGGFIRANVYVNRASGSPNVSSDSEDSDEALFE
jgi:hypothetical protein